MVAGRYEIVEELGRGGMAVVYRVVDTTSGEELALKQLLPVDDPVSASHARELFVQEYHALSHLSHPRIVAVHDYGVEPAGAFFTMELLSGVDLRARVPLAWRELCAVLCDVCSALSLLHSRRLAHRDLTPANILFGEGGSAKLIDLGAMARWGTCERIVGTPPFIPPEVLHTQQVDAQTDLYALGATAYRLLTGRHAYHARTLLALRDAWRTPAEPPSRLNPDVPPALDELVMSLLHPRPAGRPHTAAEVMERLGALAGLSIDEQLLVHRAYLTTPELVGRGASVTRVRKRLIRAKRGRGGTLVVRGGPGVGRTRLLHSTVLEAKLLGLNALWCGPENIPLRPWGIVTPLAWQLFQAAPEEVRATAQPRAPVLVHAFPELGQVLAGGDRTSESDTPVRIEPRAFATPQDRRAGVTSELHAWIMELAETRCLAVIVDDVEQLDPQSAALVAWLADAANRVRLMVAVGTRAGGAGTVAGWLSDSGATIKLRDLGRRDIQALAVSMFGDVPNVRLLAGRLYAATNGNPRSVMELCQHLLDRGYVRYHAGAWELPDAVDALELPESRADAMRKQLDTLGESAQRLARFMALACCRSLSFEVCSELMEAGAGEAAAALYELGTAEVTGREGSGNHLGDRGWAPLLLEGLPGDERRRMHAQLATVLAERSNDPLGVVLHWSHAGELERALDALLGYLSGVRVEMGVDLHRYYDAAQSLPAGWLPVFRDLTRASEELGRPVRETFELRLFTCLFATVGSQLVVAEIELVGAQLQRDAGLDVYAQLGSELPEVERLRQAIEAAQARHEALPEAERCYSPIEAIQTLPRLAMHVIAVASRAFDRQLLLTVPSLAPLRPLTPAIGVLAENVDITLEVLAGRVEQARHRIEEAARPLSEDVQGLDETSRRIIRLAFVFVQGSLEISAGIVGGAARAEVLLESPLFEANAWRLRSLAALQRGNVTQAQEFKRRLELLRMRNNPPQLFEGTPLWSEVLTYASSDDLVRTKQVLTPLAEMAAGHPGWQPALHFGRGHYQRLRGALGAALSEFEAGLSLVAAGEHILWAFLASSMVGALEALGRLDEARAHGRRLRAEAQAADLAAFVCYIDQPLSRVEASLGHGAEACALADASIEHYRRIGAQGLTLGIAYETRAEVALRLGARDDFVRHAALCSEQYRAGDNPILTAKYERLIRRAKAHGIEVSDALMHAADVTEHRERRELAELLTSLFTDCRGSDERARRVLDLLIERSGGCRGGFLYLQQSEGPRLAAQQGPVFEPPEMERLVADCLSAELQVSEGVTCTDLEEITVDTPAPWVVTGGERFVRLVLSHPHEGAVAVTGLVVLCLTNDTLYNPPYDLLGALSEALSNNGDAVTVMAAV